MASLEYCKTSNKSKLPFTFTTFISCQEYQISPAKSKKKKKMMSSLCMFLLSWGHYRFLIVFESSEMDLCRPFMSFSFCLIIIKIKQLWVPFCLSETYRCLKLLKISNKKALVGLNIRKTKLCNIQKILKSIEIKFVTKIMEWIISVETYQYISWDIIMLNILVQRIWKQKICLLTNRIRLFYFLGIFGSTNIF